MKTTEIVHGALTDPHLTDMLDQLDPAIGEASSVMGAMATELIRRSLRGGVLQIGRELSGFVGQQVELHLVEQRPSIEKTAALTATEVARGEVDAVRHAAQEQDQQLALRIDDASRQAQHQVETVARDLTGRLDETARQTHEKVETVARDLTGRVDETARQTHEKVETVARDLTGRLDETARQTHEKIETVAKAADDTARHTKATTDTLAQTLHTEVAAVETRTLDTARKEFTTEIDAFKERARQATQKIKDRLDKLDAASAELADLQRALKQELLAALRTEQRQLHQQIDELRRVNESLARRVEVLEQPRGLRRLFAWLFGRKKQPAAAVAANRVSEAVEAS
ncbi:MAG: hypothetical protein L0Y71_01700 [Gemmataceae bacterium]|nr:hypothetical protein [Gemmataceae bacterium]